MNDRTLLELAARAAGMQINEQRQADLWEVGNERNRRSEDLRA